MKEVRSQKSEVRIFLSVFCILYSVFCILTFAYAKVYIDITSPALRKLPVSFIPAGQAEAKEITEIVRNDFDFTGMFSPVDANIPGAEVKISIEAAVSGQKVTASVAVMDLLENTEILKGKYTAEKTSLRLLSHHISNEIFKAITGQNGIFRTRLSYIANISGKKELHLMDWDGHNDRDIGSRGLIVSHNWSSGGDYLTYSSERNKEWGIYLLTLANYKETFLFSSRELNLAGGFSPSGSIVFSSSRDGSPEIYTMNSDGSNVKKLTRSIGIDVSPAFSPDGSQIAFVSDRGGTPQIYLMNSDGSGIRRITFEGNYNTSPSWSPDGKWIAYVGRKEGLNQIFIVNTDTGDAGQLTDKGNNESPSFSPDGMFIALDSDREGAKGIYIIHIKGGWQKRITPKGMRAATPRWSPYLK
ncbi:MAG: PD40 domain-containing protein [Nitrospirae bacterium]|nr:PD40 domain-containing protein [Nitrospirota bacterium]